jgi:uncharacterized repeat protein (TIGR01451 family)
LKSDGTVWEWGVSQTIPVRVAALASVVAVAAGDAHSLAARNDGTVWAWGSNRYGQLGDGTTAQRSAPVPVGGVSGVVSIAAGGNHSLAVSGDGTVWAWGYNYYGQVGDGAAGIELLPVPVVPPGSPDIVISKTHAGSFSIGIPASYAITLTNVGQTATSGTLTVIDTLPVGLNFSSASGTNWTCGAAGRAITCTSPASIDPGSSSTITLNVDVLPAASPGVTNVVTVSNPSDPNASNNTTGDPLNVAGTGCSYAVTPLSAGLPVSGGTVSFAVQTDPSCSWTVAALPAWITVNGPASGTGPGNVSLAVAANSGGARSANVIIAGITTVISQAAGVCAYSISPSGQAFSATGGAGAIDLTASAGCTWSATSPVSWVTLTSASTGSGSARLTYLVAANTGAARSATLTVAGRSFLVDQSAAAISGLSQIGTLAQIASAGYWTTTFTLVNTGTTVAQVRMNFYDDNGSPLVLQLYFPQTGLGGALVASSLDRTINPGAVLLVSTTGLDSAVVQTGWALVSSDGPVSASAVLRLHVGDSDQEAVVPLETRSATGFLVPFDNTGSYTTGIGLANSSNQTLAFTVIVRDEAGSTLLTSTQDMTALGHTSFDLATRYPVTAFRRGTIEFRGAAPGQVSLLGLRFNPTRAFTTIPPAAK